MREGWRLERIGDVCKTAAGGTPLKSERSFYDGGTIPWLLSGEVGTRSISAAKQRITETGLKNSSAKVFPIDTVLVAMYGATAGQVGVLRAEAATNQAVCGIYPSDIVYHEYLYYVLLHKQAELVATASGNAQPNISQAKIRETVVPIPPLPEQKRIVAILDEALAGIATAVANTEKNLANARELFEGYLNSVFSQRGDGWEDKSLGELCRFSSGGTPSKKKASYWNGDIPWVSGRDMKSTRLSDSVLHISKAAVKESSTRIAPTGTVLILVRGMGLAHGAQLAELMAPCAFNQDIRGVHPNANILPRYLLFALRDRINSSDTVLRSAAHGTLKLDSTELANLMIPVPPVIRQKRIVADFDQIAELSLHLESIYQQKLIALAELKQSLLEMAFSGELTAGKEALTPTLKEEEVA